MNELILKEWFEQIKHFEKLKFNEAQELYKKAIATTDETLRKEYIDRIICGTLYVVYNYINKNTLAILCSSSYDMWDIINAFCEKWTKRIYSGELLKVTHFSRLFTSSFFCDICNNLVDCNYEIYEYFGITFDLFNEMLNNYLELRNKSLTFNASDLLKKHIDSNYYIFRNYDVVNNLMILFEKIYDRLSENEKINLELCKTKIKNFLRIFVELGMFETIEEDFPNKNDLEDSILDECIYEDFREKVDFILTDERTRKIIHQRYGLTNGNPETLEEIAKYHNITRERVRQIEVKTIRKLRSWHYGLKKYYLK